MEKERDLDEIYASLDRILTPTRPQTVYPRELLKNPPKDYGLELVEDAPAEKTASGLPESAPEGWDEALPEFEDWKDSCTTGFHLSASPAEVVQPKPSPIDSAFYEYLGEVGNYPDLAEIYVALVNSRINNAPQPAILSSRHLVTECLEGEWSVRDREANRKLVLVGPSEPGVWGEPARRGSYLVRAWSSAGYDLGYICNGHIWKTK